MTLDRKRLAQIADWQAVAVAASLPWSTSATSILLVLWLVTLLPCLDVRSLQRELTTAAGGLPVLLWLLAAFGMLWADVSWSERIGGLDGFNRLLVLPLLFTQFRQSDNGERVLYGFFAAALALLLLSWTIALVPALNWLRTNTNNPAYGVPVKDVISQSTVFLLCTFASIWRACELGQKRNWRLAALFAAVAILFLANLVFVAVSRADFLAAPVLIVALGWRQWHWKGLIAACLAGALLAAGAWMGSQNIRDRLNGAAADIQAYQSTHVHNDIGDHIEFLKKSLSFVREAPAVGHGTGSIADLFRRSAAGETGAAGVASVNPHNQIFAVAIQLGLLGAAVLLAMWAAHYLLFRATSFTAWIGAVVLIENFVSSLFSSHLFDFMHGWLYVFGVGVAGGMMLRETGPDAKAKDS